MTGNASQFIGDIPGSYDRYLGPIIFESHADDVARRIGAVKPSSVLELAAGTGIVSRRIYDALPASTQLVVTDLNPPMLEVAKTKFKPGEHVTFRTADAMKLDFPDTSFDAIACQFGVMFFPDKRASFREALRVLRPGGRYIFSAWGTMDENRFSAATQDVLAQLFPKDTPGFYRVPFSYADAQTAITDLKTSGFADVQHDVVALARRVHDLGEFARGLVYGNPLIDEIAKRGGPSADDVMKAVEIRLRKILGPEPSTLQLKANVFTARAPN